MAARFEASEVSLEQLREIALRHGWTVMTPPQASGRVLDLKILPFVARLDISSGEAIHPFHLRVPAGLFSDSIVTGIEQVVRGPDHGLERSFHIADLTGVDTLLGVLAARIQSGEAKASSSAMDPVSSDPSGEALDRATREVETDPDSPDVTRGGGA